MTTQKQDLLRSLPAVSTLLEHEEVVEWLAGLGQASVTVALRRVLEETRQAILNGTRDEPIDPGELVGRAEEILLERSIPSLRRVINATGVVLHTGLGRAPLSQAAVEAMAEGAAGYCNLEYDLTTGKRGRRTSHVAELLTSVTGAEAATAVNNNAAATLLILATFCSGREVIVSRGQLVEIGGSFRLPDILRAGGAVLREVGTTNRTRLDDYADAIGDSTAMLLRVHTSNYRIIGFTEAVEIESLAELGHQRGLIVVDDLGSGALVDLSSRGLPAEPRVQDSIDAGADLVCFSGDKLLGGPQCGLIVGRKDLIDQLESHPLMRTYRLDKLVLFALEMTLRAYRDADDGWNDNPTLSMLTTGTDELGRRAGVLADLLGTALPGEHFYVCSDVGYAGGGALPAHALETVVVQWRPTCATSESLACSLRAGDVPVVARIRDDAICFDLRTVRESEFEMLVSSISAALMECSDAETD